MQVKSPQSAPQPSPSSRGLDAVNAISRRSSSDLPRRNPHAMGKNEMGSRAAEKDERPRKAPRLSSAEDDEDSEPCPHILAVADQVDSLVAKIKSRDRAPRCEHCWLDSFKPTASSGGKQQRDKPRTLIMVCLDCKRCLCAGVAVETIEDNPCGHAWFHAKKKGHWVALWFHQPCAAYCFSCDTGLYLDPSDGENEMVVESAVDDESGAADATWPDTDGLLYVIRGIPNCGNTCYMNSLVQCLLVLDKLRTWMLGPNAPRGSLGVALKEFFVETTPGHNAGEKLYPRDLLERLGALNARYAGNDMQDSQELLLDLRNGLIEEEKLLLPPNMRDRVPTVVDSIFQGHLSSTLTCKCLYVSRSHDPFSELSLTLPSKGETIKSVYSPQRSPAIEETNLRKAQIDAEGGDFHIHGLELESVAMDKTSELLRTDSTKENAEDTASPVRKKDASASGSDGQSDNARVGDLLSQQEILVEAKESTSTEQVTTEDKGKALSRNDEDCSSLASIKHCLVLYFKDEKVVWSCEKCSKVPVESGGSGPVKDLASSSTSNEESDHDVKAEKRFDMFIAHDSQNASTSPDRRKQIDLNSADQVRENKTEQKDADKALVISKLPPVLTLHLKRFARENNKQVKVTGHVSFEENLDVGQFMDPRSEDKDNSRYCLAGVVEHVGDSLNSGHYVAYVRTRMIGSHQHSSSGSSLWFRASDEHIKRVSLEEVLKCEAFLLFYERMECPSSCYALQSISSFSSIPFPSSSMPPHHKVGPQALPRKRKKNSVDEGNRIANTGLKTLAYGKTIPIQQPGNRARTSAADADQERSERSKRAQSRINRNESIARVLAELPGPTPWKVSENSKMLQATERIKELEIRNNVISNKLESLQMRSTHGGISEEHIAGSYGEGSHLGPAAEQATDGLAALRSILPQPSKAKGPGLWNLVLEYVQDLKDDTYQKETKIAEMEEPQRLYEDNC